MKIAVLMTCHNRCQKTSECLTHLFGNKKNENLFFDVYLVDDGSTDGTSEFIKQNFPQVKIIAGNGNLYWNRGMLLAWKTALKSSEFDAVLWLNDDTILENNALERLVSVAIKHKNAIVVGSTGWKSNTSKFSYGGYNNYKELLTPIDSEMPCRFFNGNIVLIPKFVSDKIGMLDSYFRHAKGDFEYGLRASSKGVEIFVLPIIGYCDRNDSYVKWTDTKYSLIQRLKFVYSPLGNNPFEAFYYYRKISIKKAFKVFIYIHLKTVFPYLFK